MSNTQIKWHEEQLQERVLAAIQDFELKTDRRVSIVAYVSIVKTVVQPRRA